MDKVRRVIEKWAPYVAVVYMSFWVVEANYEPVRLMDRTNADFVGDLNLEIDGSIERQFGGPYDYRILAPYAISAISRALDIPRLTTNAFAQGLLMLAALMTLFSVMRNLGSTGSALLSVLGFSFLSCICLAYIPGPMLAETQDLLNIVVFLLFILALIKRKAAFMALTIGVGMLNKETPLALLVLLGWLFVEDRDKWVLKALVSSTLSAVIVFAAVRMAIHTEVDSGWFQIKLFVANNPFLSWHGFINNVIAISLMGPLFLLSGWCLYRAPENSGFRKACMVASIYLTAMHYVFGVVRELRVWFPAMLLLLICSSPLFSLFSGQTKNKNWRE